jgi:hypothetical protein
MFEVGKKYQRMGYDSIWHILYVGEHRTFARTTDGTELGLLNSDFPKFKEYVEPKVVKQVLKVCLASDGYIYTGSDTSMPANCIGKVSITHIEGQGLAVEVIG